MHNFFFFTKYLTLLVSNPCLKIPAFLFSVIMPDMPVNFSRQANLLVFSRFVYSFFAYSTFM